ncbi:MAG: thymidine phosphorylase [Bdellovibrionota bacterium]
MNHIPVEIIKKKRRGFALTTEEIDFFIQGYTKGEIPDYQMSALLMAIFFKKMDAAETLALTSSMLHSGEVVDFSFIPRIKVDKHSTGGVGDKTSLLIAPIVACLDVPVPMISGRGLGHTGGTLDKLESIPGFNTQLNLDQFKKMVASENLSFIGQTKEICPADKKIYALRDVTATVENLSLICASIMSKKIAEGIDALVLDVKYGSGAFMKNLEDARELAIHLMSVGKGAGKKITSLLTDMNQPLGRFAGNSLEVFECVEIFQGKTCLNLNGRDLYADTKKLSLHLAAHMAFLGGAAGSFEEALHKCEKVLESGAAYKKFEQICKVQGGDLSKLPLICDDKEAVQSQTAGFVESFNTEHIGVAGILLKAGRQTSADIIDPVSGIEFHKKTGDAVQPGEPLFSVYSKDPALRAAALQLLSKAIIVGPTKPTEIPLIAEVLRG